MQNIKWQEMFSYVIIILLQLLYSLLIEIENYNFACLKIK